MKSRFDFNHVSEITGAFVILAVITVVVLLTMTARVQRWFEPVYTLTVDLPSEEELPVGPEVLQDAAVLISATTVGTVDDVDVDDSGNVHAILSLQGDLVKELKEDAEALVSLPFLAFLGEPSIKLSKGTRGLDPLFPPGVKEAKLAEVALPDTDLQKQLKDWNEIALKWENYFDNWNEIAHQWEGRLVFWNEKAQEWEARFVFWNERAQEWEQRFAVTYERIDKELTEPDGRLIVFMDNLNLLLDRLANEGLVAWATRDPEWNEVTLEMMKNVETGAAQMTETIDLMNAIIAGGRPLPPPFAETVAELPDMAKRVNDMLDRTERVLAQVELASESLPAMANSVEKDMRTLPGFLIESQETLRQVEIMVRALQRHWLLRDYVDPRPAKGRIPVEDVVGPLGGDR